MSYRSVLMIAGIGALAMWCVTVTAATTVVECVAPDGTVSYNAFCPPGSTKQAERRYVPEPGARRNALDAVLPAITLFSIADCDACDLVRNVLDTRDVPYNEKNVADNQEHQTELLSVTGGTLSVPTVLIGENSLRGYNRSAIENALNQAGYPDPRDAKASTE